MSNIAQPMEILKPCVDPERPAVDGSLLIVYNYSWGANPDNTDARLQAVADRTGVPILPVQARGTGRTVIDLAARRSLHPNNFEATSHTDARPLRAHATDHTLIGWGDSGRGVNILGMQATTGVFKGGVVIRDGINLLAPQRPYDGYSNFAKYLLDPPESAEKPTDIPESAYDRLGKAQKIAAGLRNLSASLAEAVNYSPLLRSAESRQLALDVAEFGLPAAFVTFSDTFTGSDEQQQAFLRVIARKAGRDLPSIEYGVPQTVKQLQLLHERDTHAALLRPGLAAKHLGMLITAPKS